MFTNNSRPQRFFFILKPYRQKKANQKFCHFMVSSLIHGSLLIAIGLSGAESLPMDLHKWNLENTALFQIKLNENPQCV